MEGVIQERRVTGLVCSSAPMAECQPPIVPLSRRGGGRDPEEGLRRRRFAAKEAMWRRLDECGLRMMKVDFSELGNDPKLRALRRALQRMQVLDQAARCSSFMPSSELVFATTITTPILMGGSAA